MSSQNDNPRQSRGRGQGRGQRRGRTQERREETRGEWQARMTRERQERIAQQQRYYRERQERRERTAQQQREERERRERERLERQEREERERYERMRRLEEEMERRRQETGQNRLENKKRVVCGGDYTFVQTDDNQLWACGWNSKGQLGLGDNELIKILTKLNWTGGAVKQIACGTAHTFILTEDNQLWACGFNKFGQLGLGDNYYRKTLTKLNWTGGAVKQVTCGDDYTFVLTEDNQLWACGRNQFGQLGLGPAYHKKTLTKLNWTGGAIKQVSCGDHHTFVLTDDNKLWACGSNYEGQLGLGLDVEDDNPQPNTLTKLDFTNRSIKQVVCGTSFTFVLTNDNQLWACGKNSLGQLGINVYDTNKLTKLNWRGGAIRQVDCGVFHTFVLTEDNQLWACGLNANGQLGLGDNISRDRLTKLNWTDGSIKQVACGNHHTFVLGYNNQLWACGTASAGEIGFGDYSKPVYKLVQIYLQSEDPDGRLRQIEEGRLEPIPDEQQMVPIGLTPPTVSAEQQRQEHERRERARQELPPPPTAEEQERLTQEAQRRIQEEQERQRRLYEERKKREAEQEQQPEKTEREKAIIERVKRYFQIGCDNEADFLSLENWHDLAPKDRDDVISISINGQGRQCYRRPDLLKSLQEESFKVWHQTPRALYLENQYRRMQREPILQSWDDQGHGGEVDPQSPVYGKAIPTLQYYFLKEDTLRLLRNEGYMKYNMKPELNPNGTPKVLRLGNILGGTGQIVTGAVHGQAPGQTIAVLEPIEGAFHDPPPPVNQVQQGGKHTSKYYTQYLKANKRYKLFKSQFS